MTTPEHARNRGTAAECLWSASLIGPAGMPQTVQPESPPSREAIVIILARAGSKGVPGKNTMPIAGRPCVEWTIHAAQESRRVGSVVMSTDCPRARTVGEYCGITVVDRPCELASDTASVDDAARDALVRFECERGIKSPDPRTPIVLLYANVPVRPVDLIDECVRTLVSSGAESVQSYSEVGKHHPWWTCVVEADGSVRGFDAEPDEPLFHGIYRRQQLPPAHIPDGGVTVVTRRSLMLEVPGAPQGPHGFLGPACVRRGVVSPEGSVVDIDSPADALVADAMLKGRGGGMRWERRVGATVRRAG